MLPAGYMAKKVAKGSENRLLPERITDIYSVSHCISPPFDENYFHGKINEFRFFDSPGIIANWADENAINLTHCTMFYFEIFEFEFHQSDQSWQPYVAQGRSRSNVVLPIEKYLAGYDIVSFSEGNLPECSPLSCNALAREIETNCHCLLDSFDQAKSLLEKGHFDNTEPGPFRIFAVYSVPRA